MVGRVSKSIDESNGARCSPRELSLQRAEALVMASAAWRSIDSQTRFEGCILGTAHISGARRLFGE
jgi:hypothetical protein